MGRGHVEAQAGATDLLGAEKEAPLKYRVIGVGLVPVEYHMDTLADAAHLADRMSDQGVSDVHVFDKEGRELSAEELQGAPLPSGSTRLND